MIEAVFFDFDGTLYDLKRLPVNLIFSSLRDALLMRAERTVRREFYGKDFGNTETLRCAFNRRMSEVTGKSEEAIDEWFTKRYPKTMQKVLSKKYHARKGTEELFKSLHEKGIKIVVISDYPWVKERMTAIGISEETQNLCDKICSSQDYGCYKPCPKTFMQIAHELGVKEERCLVIGDRADTDGESARGSGMQFVQVDESTELSDQLIFVSAAGFRIDSE